MRKLLNLLVYSNAYLAIGAACVAYITTFLLKLPADPFLLFIPFSVTMFIYNLNRQTDKKEDIISVPERSNFVDKYGKYFLLFGTFVYIIALLIALSRNIGTVTMVLAPSIIGVIYSIFRLKRHYITKNVSVAIAWGTLPLVAGFYFNTINDIVLLLSTFFAMEFFINTVIFDVKDVKGDMLYKIRTLPIVAGIKKTKWICGIVNILSAALIISGIAYGALPVSAIMLAPFILYVFLYIVLCGKTNGIFYGVFVDGEFLFTALIIAIASMVLQWL